MKARLVLLLVGLVVASLFLPPSVVADSVVEIPGSRSRDYTAVNGTALIGFWLQSQAPVSEVVLFYVDREEKLSSGTMELVEGDEHDGWWEATIEPNRLEEEVDGGTRYRLELVKLRVFLPESVIEIDVSERLAAWTRETVTSRELVVLSPWSITVLGAALAGAVIGIVSLRNRLRGRWMSKVSQLAGAVIGIVSLRDLRRRGRRNGVS